MLGLCYHCSLREGSPWCWGAVCPPRLTSTSTPCGSRTKRCWTSWLASGGRWRTASPGISTLQPLWRCFPPLWGPFLTVQVSSWGFVFHGKHGVLCGKCTMSYQEQEGFASWQVQTAFWRQPPLCVQVCSHRCWEICDSFVKTILVPMEGPFLAVIHYPSVHLIWDFSANNQYFTQNDFWFMQFTCMWPRVLNTMAFSDVLFPLTSPLLTFSPLELWAITGWIWVS